MMSPSLHIALQDFKFRGHRSKYAYRQAVELARQGAGVSLIVPSAFPLEEMRAIYGRCDDVHVYRLDAVRSRNPVMRGRSIASEVINISRLLKLCSDLQVDILHLVDYAQLFRGLAVATLLRRLNQPRLPVIVSTLHRTQLWDSGFWRGRPLGRLRQWFRQTLFTYSVRLGLYTCFVHPSYVTMLPRDAFHMTPLSHPVDHPGPSVDQQIACEKLGLVPGGKYALLFGIMNREKGLDLALASLARLPHVKLIIAGAPSHGMTEASVMQQIQSSGRADQCVVRLGYVPEAEVPLYFAAAHVVLLPYRPDFRALSGSTLLAISYRRPIVTTDVGGNGYTVRCHGLGRVVPPENPEQFAQAIAEVLSWDNAQWTYFIKAADAFLRAASWEMTTAQLLAAYQAAFAAKTGNPQSHGTATCV